MKTYQSGKAKKILFLAMALMLVLSACGGSQNSGNTTGTTGKSEQKTAENNTNQGSTDTKLATDGVLDVGYTTTPDTLTPFRSNTNRDAPYFPTITEQLAIFDVNNQLQPWVAKSWETKDNGFTYDVVLREGVKDSAGNEINADDILWFMNKSKEMALKPIWGKMESVEKTGDQSIRVKLTKNIVGTMEAILTDTYVISQKAFEASKDEFGTSIISTSPYEVTEFVANSILRLKLRDNYWQDYAEMPECVRPAVPEICYHAIPEASQVGIALETGTIDVAIRIDNSTGAQFEGKPEYVIELADGPQGWTLFFSGADTSPMANDEKLRQAACYAIDPQGLITGLCAGYGTPMYDAHSPLHIGALEKWKTEEYYPYNLEKAKQLVAESNYKGQKLTILCSTASFSSRLAQIVQNYLLAAGLNVELYQADMAQLTAIRLDGTKYDMFINTIGGVYLPDAWTIRYDPAAYATGDGTSRKDYTLAELLYKTWTPEGFTEANIDEVHNYLKDHAIAYGMVDPQNMVVWRADIGLEKEVKEKGGYIAPASSSYAAFPMK